MNRKILSLLTALLLCLNFFPVQSLEDEALMIGAPQVMDSGNPEKKALTFEAAPVMDSGKPEEDSKDPNAGLCPHHPVHTEACGYIAAEDGKAGTPCTFDCVICNIQALIDALPQPEDVMAADEKQLMEQINAIRQRMAGLSPENAALVDVSRLEALEEVLIGPKNALMKINSEDAVAAVEVAGAETQYFATAQEAFAAANSSQKAVVRLLKDAELTGANAVKITSDVTLEAGEFTLSGAGGKPELDYTTTMFVLYEGGTFTLQSGTICSTASTYVISVRGGTFNMTGGTIKSDAAYGQHVLYVVDTTSNADGYQKTTSTINLTGGTINTPQKSVYISGEGASAKFSGCNLTVYSVNLNMGAALDISDGGIVAKGYTALSVSGSNGQTTRLKISGGTITIDNPSTSTGLGLRCLYVQEPVSVQLSGGTLYNKRDYTVYTGDSTIINGSQNSNLNQLLMDGYGYNQNGVWLSESEVNDLDKLIGTVKVGKIPLAFTEQPVDTVIHCGEDKFLRAAVERSEDTTGEVTYQWFCRPKVEDEADAQEFQSVPGAVSNTFSLKETEVGKYEYYCLASCEGYEIVSRIATVTVGKVLPYITGIPEASIVYGDTLDTIPLTGCAAQYSNTDHTPVPGSFSWKEPNVKPSVTDSNTTEYTVVFTPDNTANYETVETTIKLTVHKKSLTITGMTAENRFYNGTNQVQITGVTLDGKVGSDDVSVNTAGLAGTVNGTNAGKYTAVTLPVLTLTGTAAGNYTLTQPTAAVNTNVTISKAPALTPKSGNLAVSNKQANTYTYSLGALLPDVPKGMSLGSPAVTYALGTVSLGSYYTRGAVIDGETLTLPIQKVDSEDAKEIGTVTVIIHSGNYEDMTGTLHVRSVNQILPVGAPVLSADSITYGQSIGAITLSGTMRDTVNNKDVPGTFIWSNPDDRPAVQEKYTAAWTFTPQDNETHAVVTGTASIQVLPAPITDAVIELEPAAFRYDGAVHYPKIDSVKLDDTILTADVDYTAEIPQEREPGTYTVTITGKGSYTGTATVTFTINEVKTGKITLPDGTSVLLSVETGLSSVPAGLQNTPFRTISAIKKEMQTKVTAALSDTNGQIAIYDVRLQYKDKEDGEWKDVDPDHFPEDGVIAIIPYPNGTNGTDYIFTVQHMISHGANAGIVETLTYTALSDGLQCRFNSLSPVAVGYKAIEKKPSGSVESSSGGKGNSSSGKGGSGGSSSSNAQYDFWQQVRQKIGKAQPGDIVKVNARGYDKMPRLVMDALKKSDGVTLMIHWNGGKDITIDSDKALDEALRIYYPLSYLTDYDFGNHIEISSVNPLAGAYEDTAPLSSSDDYHFDNAANPKNSSNPSKQNPKTGGVWEINAPITAEAPLTIAGTPEITNAQRGLAETPELASQGVEKAIPGIYEPVEPADVPIQNGRNSAFPMVLVFLLAAACGGAWVWKSRFRNSKNS